MPYPVGGRVVHDNAAHTAVPAGQASRGVHGRGTSADYNPGSRVDRRNASPIPDGQVRRSIPAAPPSSSVQTLMNISTVPAADATEEALQGASDAVRAALAVTLRGCEELLPPADWVRKLRRSEATGQPLRISFGLDPTAPDIHLTRWCSTR